MTTFPKVPLGSLVKIVRGISYKSSELADSDKGVPMVNLRNVGKGGGFREDGLKYYTGEFKSTQVLNPGDLILANTDLSKAKDVLGSPFLVPASISGAVLSLDLSKLVPDESVIDKRFLNYFLQSPEAREFMKTHGQGITVMHLRMTALPGLQVPVPPLDEQRSIVETLDDHLSRLDKALAETEYSSLGTKRFSASLLHSMFTGDLMKRELGIQVINIVELADVAEVQSGGTPKGLERLTSETVSETHNVPFYKVGDMNRDARYMKSSRSYLTEVDVDSLRLKVIPTGSVVFPKAGGAIATDKKRLVQIPGPIDLNCMAVIPGAKMIPSYLAWFFESFKLSDLSNGSILPQIGKTAVMQVRLPCPSLTEQEAVVQYLEENISKVREQVQSIEGVASSIATLRRSILNDAFSGRLVDRDSSEQ